VPAEYKRGSFVYGKDFLVEKKDERIDVSKRQTSEVLEFKKDKTKQHNR
jgi:hypothetical protein